MKNKITKYGFLDNKKLSLQAKGLMIILIERIGEKEEECSLYDAVNKIHPMPESLFGTLINNLSHEGYISMSFFRGRIIYDIFPEGGIQWNTQLMATVRKL